MRREFGHDNLFRVANHNTDVAKQVPFFSHLSLRFFDARFPRLTTIPIKAAANSRLPMIQGKLLNSGVALLEKKFSAVSLTRLSRYSASPFPSGSRVH